MFGITWRAMIRTCDEPSARADSTNGKPITSSTAPRTTRAKAGAITIPIAIIALRRFGPSRPAITIASTSPGSANMRSTNRISSAVDLAAEEAGEQADRERRGRARC